MRRHVLTIGPRSSVRTAAIKLILFGVESLIVTEGGVPVGIVTQRDLLAAAMPRMDEIIDAGSLRDLDFDEVARSHSERPVGDIMTRTLSSTAPSVPAKQALGRMLAHRLRRLPVLDPETGALLGILTQRDLLGVVYLDGAEAMAHE